MEPAWSGPRSPADGLPPSPCTVTGCSSIWGAQAYETPYSSDAYGYGAAWMNPLFENNAAVGGGMALGIAAETSQMNASARFVSEAIERRPEFARTWNDLSAALLTRADERDRPEDLLEALAAAERSLRLQPGVAAADKLVAEGSGAGP